ncbi:MAG: hypothetical protein HYU48_00335 [Candidatus Levybacteria bacterium]|nr:hypothetical protein [Candidatus Levybacteria bacterium]
MNNNTENLRGHEIIKGPEYSFTKQGTLVFITGAPLSGKSTISPLVAATIKSCALQNMDIIRLIAQEIDRNKPKSQRNPFVTYGSCDSYVFIGDGSYSPEHLIEGFNGYSEAVSSVLTGIIPKLELQGERNVLFEGVQLIPSFVSPYLTNNNKLIVIRSDASQINLNRHGMFAGNQELIDRYSTERILLLQEEILRQSRTIPQDKVFYVDNTGDYTDTVIKIIQFLLNSQVIK